MGNKNSINNGSNSSSEPKGLSDSPKKANSDENESYLGDHDNELLKLQKIKNSHLKNPAVAHLNINSLRHKIIDLRKILKCAGIDFVSLSETNLHGTFQDSQFTADNYISFRRDRNQFGGGLIFIFVKKGLLPSRKQDLELELIEILSVKITVKKRKWIIHTVYRPPSSDLALFFN